MNSRKERKMPVTRFFRQVTYNRGGVVGKPDYRRAGELATFTATVRPGRDLTTEGIDKRVDALKKALEDASPGAHPTVTHDFTSDGHVFIQITGLESEIGTLLERAHGYLQKKAGLKSG